MNKYRFKTNIKCGGCIAQVTPHLNNNENIKDWSVDTANPDKILTVEATQLEAQDIAHIVEKAGYKAEPIQ